MSGRSLHDALLTVLADGEARAALLSHQPAHPLIHGIAAEDWTTLSALPAERLAGISRFLARQYYRERIVRLFRAARLLTPITGRDPCTVLQTPAVQPILDGAVLGSRQTAERLLALLEAYLTENDDAIQAALPWWRDLIRYQATLFRVEAGGHEPASEQHTRAPRRAGSSQLLELEWDLPELLRQLRALSPSSPADATGLIARHSPTTLLVACGRHGRVTTIRCTPAVRTILEAADGTRDAQTLAQVACLPYEQAVPLLQQLEEIGAIL
jgi:hypothetical protein